MADFIVGSDDFSIFRGYILECAVPVSIVIDGGLYQAVPQGRKADGGGAEHGGRENNPYNGNQRPGSVFFQIFQCEFLENIHERSTSSLIILPSSKAMTRLA